MKKSASLGRYQGRIKVVIGYLLAKYGLSIDHSASQELLKPSAILLSLTETVSESDKNFCIDLAAKSSEIEANPEEIVPAEVQNGIAEGHYLINKYGPNYRKFILQDEDFLAIRDAEIEDEKKRTRMVIRIACVALAIIVLSIITYNLPYFAEKRMYSKVQETFNDNFYWEYDHIVNEYLAKYPDGKHKDDVLYLPVEAYWKTHDAVPTIDAVSTYLEKCPDGSHAAEARKIHNEVWNSEIAKYKKVADSKASKDGSDFIINMMTYMRDHYVRTVYVATDSKLELKEYSEYPADIRNALELTQFEDSRFKLPDDINTIKDKITKEDTNEWAHELIASLQQGFDKVLTNGFIQFEKSPEDSNYRQTNPYVILTYTVKTQETKFGSYSVPDIWTYTETNYGWVTDGGLYLGISLDFIADFHIPDNNNSFEVSAGGDPGDTEISNIDPSEVYSRMCERCAISFTNKIESAFGLEKE